MRAKQIVRANFNLEISHSLNKNIKLHTFHLLINMNALWVSPLNIKLEIILISHPRSNTSNGICSVIWNDVSSFSNTLSHIKLYLMSFCNVRELLNVGFEIRTQNSTPMAIIPSEDINRKSHLYHKLDYWGICNL